MQFEGEHKAIPLRGIERAAANGVGQDGGMNEVINLLPRNGSYVPYAPEEMVAAPIGTRSIDTTIENYNDSKNMVNVDLLRVHHTSTCDNIIMAKHGLNDSYYFLVIHQFTSNSTLYRRVTRYEYHLYDVVFISNRMDLETDKGIMHLLWKDGEYINSDDISIHENGQSVLPFVNFKVERGIYDGSTEYKGARYVKLHHNYTDADTSTAAPNDAKEYVRSIGSLGGDALALLDSIRHAGGITGYVLVAAAWRVKGSDITNPRYVMASPVLLMGAPEIYIKDGQYEPITGSRFNKPNNEYLLDMLPYDNRTSLTYYEQLLWNLKSTDDRDADEIAENDNAWIELQDTSNEDPCVLRKGDGNDTSLRYPSLWSTKYAIWNWNSEKDEHRGIRVTQGTGTMLSYKLSEELDEMYKDEIDRLCIFVSPIVSPYKNNSSTGIRMKSTSEPDDPKLYMTWVNHSEVLYNPEFYADSFMPVMKSESEIRDEIKNIVGLYKVAEVQLNELQANTWLKVNLSDGRLDTDRMVQHSDTMLKITDIQPVGFKTGHIFGYNERLHVFNYQKDEVYRLPYAAMEYFGGAGQYGYTQEATGTIRVEVEDSNGSIIVDQFTPQTSALNPLISCADMDAHEITVIRRKITTTPPTTTYWKKGSEEFTPIKIAGMIGGAISNTLEPVVISTSNVTPTEYSNVRPEYINPDSYSYGKNEIRVSNTASTIFEANKSYKVGHGEIIALARLSIGLSQDNYGKYPLVVFCTDGIYTLSVDTTGKYAYGTQDPLSRVVCTNKNGICEIDGAVLFPSEHGLQIVTSGGVKPVAIQAIGEPKNNPGVANGLNTYAAAIQNDALVQLSSDISAEDFLAYTQLSDTYIKYLHALQSVIVYNKTKGYSYIIDLGSWVVTKIEHQFMFDDNDYPKQNFYTQIAFNTYKTIQFDYYSQLNNSQCLLATRAIALETRHMKSAYRVVLRGSFEYTPASSEQRYAGLYVFGSYDGNNWERIGAKEKLLTSNRFHDIGVETHRVSHKYMMIVFAGTLSKDSHIDGLEITSNTKYDNKLK